MSELNICAYNKVTIIFYMSQRKVKNNIDEIATGV